MQNSKKDKIIKIVGLFLVVIFVVLYFLGYRVTSDLHFGRMGVLILDIPYKNTDIYINSNKKITTKTDQEKVEVKLTPTTHKIIVSLKDFYPWAKDIKMDSNKTIELSPMFVPQSPSGYLIGELDKEYYKIKQLIAENKLPTKDTPKLSTYEEIAIFVENNTIFITKNQETREVLKSEVPIKNLDFYKNRTDVLIFSAGDSVYAIETEKSGVQNFMPIYKGQNPFFANESDRTIFVSDNGVLMQVAI